MSDYANEHLPIFDQPAKTEPKPTFPSGAPVEDRPRLSNQCWLILEALRGTPDDPRPMLTNKQLMQIAQRFGARLKELKDAGVRYEREHLGGGLNAYRLTHDPIGPRNGRP